MTRLDLAAQPRRVANERSIRMDPLRAARRESRRTRRFAPDAAWTQCGEPDAPPLVAGGTPPRRPRRFAPDAACTQCGEHDARALVAGATPMLCRECRAARAGRSPIEWHHPAGQHNSEMTIAMPANDHRILSDYQHDWPLETL